MATNNAPKETGALSAYGDGVKWMVGLSAGAVGGAFLHIDQFAEQAIGVRLFLAVVVGLFLVSIWAGVHYLLWLNRTARNTELINELTTAIPLLSNAEKPAAEQRLAEAIKSKTDAEKTMPSWHRLYTRTFSIGLLLSAGVFVAGVLAYKKPPNESKPLDVTIKNSDSKTERFAIALSAVHRTNHGQEAHTFLIDHQTGELWQMICRDKDEVEFKHVPRVDADDAVVK